MEISLTARVISSTEGQSLGFVSYVLDGTNQQFPGCSQFLDDAELLKKAREVAKSIGELCPESVLRPSPLV